jgi:hypothetical protein
MKTFQNVQDSAMAIPNCVSHELVGLMLHIISNFVAIIIIIMALLFSNLPNPSGRTMALGSTQPLTEMSTRNLKKETWR